MAGVPHDRAELGRQAEQLACAFLQGQGLTLLERNYQCRLGEIDLVMQQGDATVFVEVRYRGASALVDAAGSVDRRKQAKLLATAQYYLQRHPRQARKPCRIDVIAVSPATAQNRIQWITNAIELD